MVACFVHTADWWPLDAPWWRGKEVCIIGANLDGNFFLRHCGGTVRHWDHRWQSETVVAASVREFVDALTYWSERLRTTLSMYDNFAVRLTTLVLVCSMIAAIPSAKSFDGDVPDPFCNVQVAHVRRQGTNGRSPQVMLKMEARLTRNGIKNLGSMSGYGPDTRGIAYCDFWICVYPPDAAKARRLVEAAKWQGWHIEPDYTAPVPVFQ